MNSNASEQNIIALHVLVVYLATNVSTVVSTYSVFGIVTRNATRLMVSRIFTRVGPRNTGPYNLATSDSICG